MRFSACNLLLREQLKIGRKKKIITVDQVALPQTETFFFQIRGEREKTNYSLLHYLLPCIRYTWI